MNIKARLVKQQKIEFGDFRTPIQQVNLLDAKISSKLPLPRWFKFLRLKEFQAFQGGDARFFYNIAIFNAKLSAFVQIRMVDILNDKQYNYEQQVLPFQLKIPDNVLKSTNTYSSKKMRIEVENNLENNFIRVKFSADATKDLPAITGEIRGEFGASEHLVVSVPFAENKGMYAHKNIVPMSGFVQFADEVYSFEESRSFFILDDHKGFYPYRLKWDWLTAAYVGEGGLVGLNLTSNQSIDAERYNENALWLDGQIHKLPPISFERDGGVWQVRDAAGRVDLEFVTQHPKVIRANFGPFGASNCDVPMGWVSGQIKTAGETVIFDRVFSYAERMYIRC